MECPVCGKMYDRAQQDAFEGHVQDHFQQVGWVSSGVSGGLQGSGLVDISIRGWDLGID
jgi:hypothetical protein